MPSAAGFLFSSLLGLTARRMQLSLVGRKPPQSWNALTGYGLSVSAFIGGYLVCDHFIDKNRQLLNRRLKQLHEQRSQIGGFYEFDLDAEHRTTAAAKTSRFYNLFDKFGQDYK